MRCGGAALAAMVTLAACVGSPAELRWARAGTDDATVAREANDCRAQARAAMQTQKGINEDRSATLGRNWALSYTTGLQDQTMREQDAAAGERAFNACMRAKGFSPKA
jgi:hypothetical protein